VIVPPEVHSPRVLIARHFRARQPLARALQNNGLTTGVTFQSKTGIAVGIGVRVRGEDVELGILAAIRTRRFKL